MSKRYKIIIGVVVSVFVVGVGVAVYLIYFYQPADTDLIQGKWQLISYQENGRELSVQEQTALENTILYFYEKQLRVEIFSTIRATVMVQLNEKTDPKEIDITDDSAPEEKQHIKGIYKIEEDHLTLCLAKPKQARPTSFQDRNAVLMRLKQIPSLSTTESSESALQRVRKAANRLKSAANLSRLALALHLYYEEHGRFPPHALYNRVTHKPLLSWRVAILPYIGEKELYEQFRLIEPWDSPHNIKLLSKMPTIYAPPTDRNLPANTTYYQVFVGKRTMFPPMEPSGAIPKVNLSQRSLPDGSSNTIFVIEAAHPVPWTKPQDIAFEVKFPLLKFGGIFHLDENHAAASIGGLLGGHANAVFVDRSVRLIKRDVNWDILRLAIMRDDKTEYYLEDLTD